MKVTSPERLASTGSALPSIAYKGDELGAGQRYVLAVAPDDCTGCGICVEVCPAHERQNPAHRALEMRSNDASEREPLRARWELFKSLPEVDRRRVHRT